MVAERDASLWEILAFNPELKLEPGEVDRNRVGNSLQDLRLSLKSVRFADWVINNRSSNPSEAGAWLSMNLLPPN